MDTGCQLVAKSFQINTQHGTLLSDAWGFSYWLYRYSQHKNYLSGEDVPSRSQLIWHLGRQVWRFLLGKIPPRKHFVRQDAKTMKLCMYLWVKSDKLRRLGKREKHLYIKDEIVEKGLMYGNSEPDRNAGQQIFMWNKAVLSFKHKLDKRFNIHMHNYKPYYSRAHSWPSHALKHPWHPCVCVFFLDI